jgi:hypothetical protein
VTTSQVEPHPSRGHSTVAPSLESLALAHLAEQFPGLRRKGFSRAVRTCCAGEKFSIGIIPDGWLMQPSDRTGLNELVAIEIEEISTR